MQPVRFGSPECPQLFQQLAAGTKLPLKLDTHGADIKSMCIKDGIFCCRFRNNTQLFGFPALRKHWLQLDPSLAVKAAQTTASGAGALKAAPKAAPSCATATGTRSSKGAQADPPPAATAAAAAAAGSSQPPCARHLLRSSSHKAVNRDAQAAAAAAAKSWCACRPPHQRTPAKAQTARSSAHSYHGGSWGI